jgi:IS5 family transposase
MVKEQTEVPGEVVEKKSSEINEPKQKGKLILDATCAPADIKYPTDLGLLNQAREHTEKIIDALHTKI